MKNFRLLLLLNIIFIQSCHSQYVADIVLINIGEFDRTEIAKTVAIINANNPSVISLDLEFSEIKEEDLILNQALEECKNLVMASIIQYFGEDLFLISLAANPVVIPDHARTGFVSAEKGQTQWIKIHERNSSFSEDIEYHFSIVTAMAFDSLKTINFINSNSHELKIDYKNGQRKFITFSGYEVLNRKITREDIEGKIVMVGFLGPGDDDKYVTPLNKNGKFPKPDMYGLEILANIVAQVLEYQND
jgi:CHASE2 domain-containing sensor protein